jgi:hypothetical protein
MPGACTISLSGITAMSASPKATMAAAPAPAPRGVAFTFTLSAMPSRGNTSLASKNAAGAARHGDGAGAQRDLPEGFDRAHVRLGSAPPHRHAQGCAREVDVRPFGDAVGGHELREAFPGQDDDVGRHAARQLRRDGLRPRALRGAGAGRDLEACGALELRQLPLAGTGEAAGNQHLDLGRCRQRPHQQSSQEGQARAAHHLRTDAMCMDASLPPVAGGLRTRGGQSPDPARNLPQNPRQRPALADCRRARKADQVHNGPARASARAHLR